MNYSLLDDIKNYTNDENLIAQFVSKLREWGCCQRCVLRFLCVKAPYAYRTLGPQEMSDFLDTCVTMNVNETGNSTEAKEGAVSPQNGADPSAIANSNKGCQDLPKTGEDAPHTKMVEWDVCSVCLGVLQNQYCKESFLEEIRDIVIKQDFHFGAFFCSLTLPVCILLREHAVWLSLNELMPSTFEDDYKKNVTPIKDAWKWANGQSLAGILNVPFDQKSSFEIQLTFVHPKTEQECSFLYDLSPNVFQKRKNNRHGWEVFNRANVLKAIQDTPEKKFRQLYQCPPKRPVSPCDCDPITCHQEALYIAGRYNKYSRILSQTPWLIDGVKKYETSVEELICEPLMEASMAAERKFSASGREDVDVRMLGTGRPFVVEFLNPRRITFALEQLSAIQRAINESTADVRVRDLQVVAKEETSVLKEGEEEKIKKYRALCWAKEPVTDEFISKLCDHDSVVVRQKTPLRVLHRRTLAVRERTVYNLSASRLDDHHFNLFLKTQAGTYVKEFVHGDFGRTVPNLGTILGTDCDILELDVEAVELDWPKSLEADVLPQPSQDQQL